MNQKQLAAEVQSVLTATATAHGCTEAEARGLLGLAIRRLAKTLVDGTNPPKPATGETVAA